MESVRVSEYDNKHYFEAEEYFDLFVCGSLSINFDLGDLEDSKAVLDNFDDLWNGAEVLIEHLEEVSINGGYNY